MFQIFGKPVDKSPKGVERGLPPVRQFHVVNCATDIVYALVADNALHATQRCAREVSGAHYLKVEQTVWGEFGVTIGDYYCFFDGRNPKV